MKALGKYERVSGVILGLGQCGMSRVAIHLAFVLNGNRYICVSLTAYRSESSAKRKQPNDVIGDVISDAVHPAADVESSMTLIGHRAANIYVYVI